MEMKFERALFFLQMLIFLWMTKNITDDIPGWGALFDDRAGDGTVSVSTALSHTLLHIQTIFLFRP